jgi:large subunit ribosomal protein L25
VIDRRALADTLKQTSESTIIVLDGLSDPVEVLVKEVAYDPVKPFVRHVDFYAFERGREMTTTVPLEFVGEAPAVKAGAVVTKVLYELTVTAFSRPHAAVGT